MHMPINLILHVDIQRKNFQHTTFCNTATLDLFSDYVLPVAALDQQLLKWRRTLG
jgi:hypothetical protein